MIALTYNNTSHAFWQVVQLCFQQEEYQDNTHSCSGKNKNKTSYQSIVTQRQSLELHLVNLPVKY